MKQLFCALILGMFVGCATENAPTQSTPTDVGPKDGSTWVVAVGMENSQFAGACPGAQVDCERMTKLFRGYTTNVQSFISSEATHDRVKAAMVRAAQNADLFIFYYSGHGGSQYTGNKLEADLTDEFLCFYDTYMLDDEIWSIISQAKGRVVMMFDACHSSTMWRAPKPITLQSSRPLKETHIADGTLSMMVFSGCPDDTYSYGDRNGGQMTSTLLKYFNPDDSYDTIWAKLEADKSLQMYEKVQRTLMGSRFGSKKIFR